MLNNKIISAVICVALSINVGKIPIKNKWEIEIPKIELKAQIAEGTTKEVMDTHIGHFANTDLWSGNVGLAAHNRGYKVNYFKDLKKLEIGDEITYYYGLGIKNYKVSEILIISDEDWSYLKNRKEENTITLITCVENAPALRRCIKGIEITKKEEFKNEQKNENINYFFSVTNDNV